MVGKDTDYRKTDVERRELRDGRQMDGRTECDSLYCQSIVSATVLFALSRACASHHSTCHSVSLVEWILCAGQSITSGFVSSSSSRRFGRSSSSCSSSRRQRTGGRLNLQRWEGWYAWAVYSAVLSSVL